jgi:hypothetical protein
VTRTGYDDRPVPVWERFFEEANAEQAAATAKPGPRVSRPPRVPSPPRQPGKGPVPVRAGSARTAAGSVLRGAGSRRGRVSVIAGVMVAGLVVLSVGAGITALSSPETEVPAAQVVTDPQPAATAAAATSGGGWCVERVGDDGSVTTGGAGDTVSGPGVIAAVEHAYYVSRSAELVRSKAGPGTQLPPAAAIQAAIDAVPSGTQFCASITPAGPGVYALTLRERRTDGAITSYSNEVRTATDPAGRVSLVSVGAAK